MPWWATTYLVILTLVIAIELIKDYRDRRHVLHILAEAISGAIGFIFVYSYFNREVIAVIGGVVIPLLILTLAWDLFALHTMKKSAYADLSAHENAEMDKYSRLFAFLFILPCYISGALISWQEAGV